VLNQALIGQLGLTSRVIDSITARERREIERRERLYRDDRSPLAVGDRTVILVDDGLATGATMLAAARALRIQRPKRIIVAVPVASREACEEFRRHRVRLAGFKNQEHKITAASGDFIDDGGIGVAQFVASRFFGRIGCF
jgi:predicted phosphoribosyltransferase